MPSKSVSILSGPCFSDEVAQDLPTAATFASSHSYIFDTISKMLRNKKFRIYYSTDIGENWTTSDPYSADADYNITGLAMSGDILYVSLHDGTDSIVRQIDTSNIGADLKATVKDFVSNVSSDITFVDGDKIWLDNGGDTYWYTMRKTSNVA